jgi:hypothetical protein
MPTAPTLLTPYEEKVRLVMHWLTEQADFAVKGQFEIIPANYKSASVSQHDLQRILEQLAEGEKFISHKFSGLPQNLFSPIKPTDPRLITIKTARFKAKLHFLDRSHDYYKSQQLKQDLAFIQRMGEPKPKLAETPPARPKPNPTPNAPPLQINYSSITGEVLLNKLFLLSKPKVGSEQQQLFDYLYKHPNTTHTATALKAAGLKFSGEPSHFVRDMGFVGDLAKVFFSTSNQGYMFRNPITAATLQELGIKHIRLRTK